MGSRTQTLLLWMLVTQVVATGILFLVVRQGYWGGYFTALPWFALLLALLCAASLILGYRFMAHGTKKGQQLYQLLSLGRMFLLGGLVVLGFIYWPSHRWAIASLTVVSYPIMLIFTTLACSTKRTQG